MNILIIILLAIAGIIVLLLIIALFMKKEHYVKREIIINAPRQKVFDYVKLLDLENNRIFSIAMGRTFEWTDFIAYFTGFLSIILSEKFINREQNL